MTLVKPLLGRWRFVRLLRSTKGSTVWLADDRQTRKIVVLSTISHARVPGLSKAVGITHEHLAPILQVLEDIPPSLIPGEARPDTPAPVAVAQHIDGKTLHERLAEKPLPIDKTVSWLFALAQAVKALHSRGAVHGAISPRAIIVARSDGGAVPVLTNLRTPANGSYCSPNRVMGKGPSAHDDVWALYATLFTCLARHAPFSGKTRQELAKNIIHGQYKKLSSFVTEPELEKLIDEGFVIRLKHRASSVSQLEAYLHQWLVERGLQPAPQPASIVPPPVETSSPSTPPESDSLAKTAYMPKASHLSSQQAGSSSLFDDDDEEEIKTIRVDSKKAMEVLASHQTVTIREPRAAGTPIAPSPSTSYPSSAFDEEDEFDDDDDDDQMKTAVFAPNAARDLLADLDEDLNDEDEEDEGETQVMHVDGMDAELRDQLKNLSANLSDRKRSVIEKEKEPPKSFDPVDALLQSRTNSNVEPKRQPTAETAKIVPSNMADQVGPAPRSKEQEQLAEPSAAAPLPPAPLANQQSAIPRSAIPTQQIDAYRKPKSRIKWPLWIVIFIVTSLVSAVVIIYALGLEGRVKHLWGRWTGHHAPRSHETAGESSARPLPSATPSASASASNSATPPTDAGKQADGDGDGPPHEKKATTPEELGDCVAGFFPQNTFPQQPDFDYVCSESDLRTSSKRLQLDVIKGGGGRVSSAMRSWSALGWYELPLLAVMRNKCCAHPPSTALPPSGDKCPPLVQSVTRIVNHACNEQLHDAAAQFRANVRCLYNKQAPRPFRYSKAPHVSNQAIFEKMVSQGCKKLAK